MSSSNSASSSSRPSTSTSNSSAQRRQTLLNIQGQPTRIRNWQCACPSSCCPGNAFVTTWLGQNWYGICASMSDVNSQDYTDVYNQFAPGTPEYLRLPYHGQQYMSGGIGSTYDGSSSEAAFSPYASSNSSSVTVAGPSGTQPGYQLNEAMRYRDQKSSSSRSSESFPDDPIPGPGMEGSSSGQTSSRSSHRSSSKAGDKRKSHHDRKGKGKAR